MKKTTEQKEYIGTGQKLYINCKGDNGTNLSTVLIPAEDAKEVLQLMEDLYKTKREELLKTLSEL